eukprot:302602-Chlamydomonas_euryale.AAC.8
MPNDFRDDKKLQPCAQPTTAATAAAVGDSGSCVRTEQAAACAPSRQLRAHRAGSSVHTWSRGTDQHGLAWRLERIDPPERATPPTHAP